MKIYKHIFVTFLSALISVLFVYGGYTIYADTVYDFQNTNLDFSNTFIIYNGEMNAFFNEKTKQLNLILEDDNFYNDEEKKAVFLPPTNIDASKDDLQTILDKCGEENVSSYCVSMGALDRYMKYVKALSKLKGTLEISPLSYVPIMNVLSQTSKRNLEIDKEIVLSENVMKATVAAYNEYSLAYPMHKKYEEIIQELTKYKLVLKSIRVRSQEFPVKFIDATSSQCE